MTTRETQSRYLRRWQSVTGFVTKVFEHDGTEDQISNHEVNVQLAGRAEEMKRIPVHTDHNGSIYVPQKNDMVEIGFLKSKTQRPYVANVIYTDKNRAPLARSGHFRREFGPDSGEKLYIEAEKDDHSAGDPNLVRIAKKSDGLSDPSTEIVLDDSGSETQVRVHTDGNIEVQETDNGTTISLKDGTIDITEGTGGQVNLSGSSKGVIKDINTTTDGDGHVTSIDLVRSSEVFVN